MIDNTAAHTAVKHSSYIISYPKHDPRAGDPHYKDFEEFKKRTKATAVCAYGQSLNNFTRCKGELEVHHAHIEFALQNAVNLVYLEAAYPGVSDPTQVGAWVETAANLEWRCEYHHRDVIGGVHGYLDASDYEGSRFLNAVFASQLSQSSDTLNTTVSSPSVGTDGLVASPEGEEIDGSS